MAQRTILVVDDDAAFRTFMTDMLAEEGYRVLTAATRTAAFDLLRESQPDLLLLDVRMETARAGHVLLDLLAASALGQALPIIVCTADGTFVQQQGPRLEAKGYPVVQKPFALDALLTLIQAAVTNPSLAAGQRWAAARTADPLPAAQGAPAGSGGSWQGHPDRQHALRKDTR